VPKFKPAKKPKVLAKKWECPGCGEPFTTEFNGELVKFRCKNRVWSRCRGTYESITVKCPECGGEITFTKSELEEERSV